MADRQPQSPGREALMVWLKFLGILVALTAFGFVIYGLRRTL